MKVILDFQSLREDPDLSEHLEAMMDFAKEAKGFVFFVDVGGKAGMQVYMINNSGLMKMITMIEEQNPGLAQMREMMDMMKKFRGGE